MKPRAVFQFHHARTAFTLIELLVVIAIIAILASMIFPSFARAREMARRSSCASNMKQLGLGMIQYKADYDERFPGAGQLQKWGVGNGHWVAGQNNQQMSQNNAPYTVRATDIKANAAGGAIYPYVKSAQIYICPSSRDGQTTGLSYGMNCALGGAPEMVVESTSEVIMLIDEAHPTDGFFWATSNTASGALSATNSSDQFTQIHNQTGNILFVDGHVKSIPFARFPAGDTVVDPASTLAKTRTTGSPRFHENAASATGDYGFGSCNTP